MTAYFFPCPHAPTRPCRFFLRVPVSPCPFCDAYLHSCANCDFWMDSRCTEPAAEKIRDPEGINFCDWYRGIVVDSADEEKTEKGKEEAEELWKKLTKK